jgi:hypothetical protein
MGWFRKKSNERVYGERIYQALAVQELGDLTPERLRLPEQTHRRYREKALLFREDMTACALLLIADKDRALMPVLREYKGLLEVMRVGRGLQPSPDVIEAACRNIEDMIINPYKWAHRWLMEFRSDPDDVFMVALFADHCLRQFTAAQTSIDETRPK